MILRPNNNINVNSFIVWLDFYHFIFKHIYQCLPQTVLFITQCNYVINRINYYKKFTIALNIVIRVSFYTINGGMSLL